MLYKKLSSFLSGGKTIASLLTKQVLPVCLAGISLAEGWVGYNHTLSKTSASKYALFIGNWCNSIAVVEYQHYKQHCNIYS